MLHTCNKNYARPFVYCLFFNNHIDTLTFQNGHLAIVVSLFVFIKVYFGNYFYSNFRPACNFWCPQVTKGHEITDILICRIDVEFVGG